MNSEIIEKFLLEIMTSEALDEDREFLDAMANKIEEKYGHILDMLE